MPDHDHTNIVATGYDAIADIYLDWGARVVGGPRERFLAQLTQRLDDRAHVLDLGCGAGIPSTLALSVVIDESVPMLEPEGEVTFQWLLAQKPIESAGSRQLRN